MTRAARRVRAPAAPGPGMRVKNQRQTQPNRTRNPAGRLGHAGKQTGDTARAMLGTLAGVKTRGAGQKGKRKRAAGGPPGLFNQA